MWMGPNFGVVTRPFSVSSMFAAVDAASQLCSHVRLSSFFHRNGFGADSFTDLSMGGIPRERLNERSRAITSGIHEVRGRERRRSIGAEQSPDGRKANDGHVGYRTRHFQADDSGSAASWGSFALLIVGMRREPTTPERFFPLRGFGVRRAFVAACEKEIAVVVYALQRIACKEAIDDQRTRRFGG